MFSKIKLTAPSDSVKVPTFASGEAQFLNPKTGRMDAVLATEQQMRHVLEESLFEKSILIPNELIKDLPFILLLGDGVNKFSCSSRELSHRVSDSQILAAIVKTDKKFYKELLTKSFISDLLVQYLDPLAFIGGYWFSYWGPAINNATSTSASLIESTIMARDISPLLTGATKFSRYKVSEEILKQLGSTEGKKIAKPSVKGFGMIPAGADGSRFVITEAELTIFDIRETGLNRMRARGVHESTINLVSSLMDYMIAAINNQSEFQLRSKCNLKNENAGEIPEDVKNNLVKAVATYMDARENDFDNPKAKEIREFWEKLPTVKDINDDMRAKRPNAIILPSEAIAQDSTEESSITKSTLDGE